MCARVHLAPLSFCGRQTHGGTLGEDGVGRVPCGGEAAAHASPGAPRDSERCGHRHEGQAGTWAGVIPAGEYGAGSVIVWDRGSYRPLPRKKKGRTLSFGQALEDGHVSEDPGQPG
ncbi:DNA polymerase ligase N-terminal domain-containing protein [Streptomyces platensis]|uniref:DNA polymerase ligase N-terminal domain-containing protein n=1 Tax=Streptomyces platensis TaxID=58346 RepID=UPI003F5F4142